MARYGAAQDRGAEAKGIGAYSGGGGGGGGQNSNYNQYTAYTPAQVKSGKAKVAKDIAKDNATAFNNLKFTKKFSPSILGMTLNVTGLAEKGFEVNKAYYEKNVIGKNNFTK